MQLVEWNARLLKKPYGIEPYFTSPDGILDGKKPLKNVHYGAWTLKKKELSSVREKSNAYN